MISLNFHHNKLLCFYIGNLKESDDFSKMCFVLIFGQQTMIFHFSLYKFDILNRHIHTNT